MTENEQIRRVLDENPDLPVVLLTASVSQDLGFCSYYHEGIDARVESLLWPYKLENEFGTAFGLNYERVYDDDGAAVDDVAESLYDNADVPWDDDDDYTRVAQMIVDDMPWEETIVIRECL